MLVVFACSCFGRDDHLRRLYWFLEGNALFFVDMAANNHAPKLAGVCTDDSSIAIAPGSMIAYAATQELRDNQVVNLT